ncbi:MAG: hypothetical protein ACYDA3_00740 [Gaiellaceae bacterium]
MPAGDRGNAHRAAEVRSSPRNAELPARLELPGALLSRSDLRALGLERRAVDAVFRACPTVKFPGYSRTLIRVEDYCALIEACTFRGDRVRPT